MVSARDFERESDVRLMQELCIEMWRRLGPFAPVHVGDVAWWMYQRPHRLAEATIRLWLEDDRCVAFAWNWLTRDAIDCVVHPDRPEVLDDVLAWADAPTFYALESDSEKVARLEAHGYVRADGDAANHMAQRLDRELDAPRLPDGYRIRTVAPDDLERRVEVHRAAFAPSRVVPASYARLQREWPYRPDLDHVVEAPDGTFAAFCIAWLDEENRAGLIEPAGTHPDHRRRGLVTAVVSAAVRSLRAAGAATTVIGSAPGSPAERAYQKVGFETVTRQVPFGKKGNPPRV